MNPMRFHELIEADHDIQNPLSPQKLARIVDYLRILSTDRVLDVGSGKGSMLAAFVERQPREIIGLELSPVFAEAARQRLAGQASVHIVEGRALDFAVEPATFDVAVCIGATFALGGLEGTLDWLARAVKSRGRIAVGEPFALRPFTPEVSARWAEYDRTIADIGDLIAGRGLTLTGIVASSIDDWDHYESQHWRAAAAWARANPDDPDAAWLTGKMAADRAHYLAEERDAFGWAVFIAEKP
jgi:SAM-dependent methyltransferase